MHNTIVFWKKELSLYLNEKRLTHSLHVFETARELCKHHGLDQNKVELAALLHDIAKDLDLMEALVLAQELGLTISTAQKQNPALIHAPLGAALLEKKYGLDDQEILDAIRHHTTGVPDMSPLELLVYVSDYLDPKRKLKNHDLIFETAKNNLWEAALLVCVSKLEYVLESLKHLDLSSIQCYNWLLGQQS